MTENQGIMTEKQAANFLSLTPRTLQAWRYRGDGPQFIRISRRCIRYRRCDLDQWLEQRLTGSTSEPTKFDQGTKGLQ